MVLLMVARESSTTNGKTDNLSKNMERKVFETEIMINDFDYRNGNGNNAGIMTSSSHDQWSTRSFDQSAGFVCERPVGGTEV
jgi:hypothetical protein